MSQKVHLKLSQNHFYSKKNQPVDGQLCNIMSQKTKDKINVHEERKPHKQTASEDRKPHKQTASEDSGDVEISERTINKTRER